MLESEALNAETLNTTLQAVPIKLKVRCGTLFFESKILYGLVKEIVYGTVELFKIAAFKC